MWYFGRAALVLSLALGFSSVFAEVDHSLQLGRSIYEQGIGRDIREIAAKLHGSVSLTGAAIACAGCHGKDGRGSGEAFIRAPDIRWENLNQPFPARRAGMAEASYDRFAFKQALRAGISSSGRRLDPAMPRFDLADDEIDALIAYLDQVGRKTDKASSRPNILGLLPAPGKNPLTDALDAKLKNCPATESGAPVAAINMLYFDSPDAAIAQLKEQLKENVQAIILAPYLIGWEDRYADALRSLPSKTVLPFTFLNRLDESDWHFSFPGIEAQILALLKSLRADGYRQLRIAYEPQDPFSSGLYTFASEIAFKQGISLASFTHEERPPQSQLPLLWLKPVVKNPTEIRAKSQSLMLAPVIFFSPDPVELQTAEWRVAYPYQPKSVTGGAWRTPVNVWAQAACRFLSQVGSGEIDLNELPEVFSWEEQTYLYKTSNLDLLSEQVSIERIVTSSQRRKN